MRAPALRTRVALLATALALAAPLACHSQGERPRSGAPQARGPKLPEPLPLPDTPPAAVHLARPDQVVERIAPWLGRPTDPTLALGELLATQIDPTLATAIAAAVDPQRAWSMVRLGSGEQAQEIVRLPLRAGAVAELSRRVAGFATQGRFGAVVLPGVPAAAGAAEATAPARVPGLPAPTPGPWLLWIDEAEGGLSLAKSLPGLVTGRELAAAYGDEPVFATVDPALLGLPELARIERAELRGQLHDLVASATFVADGDPWAEVPLTEGALTGLLDDGDIALGATSNWTGHTAAVKRMIRQIQQQVDGLNFLVKGTVQEMANKFYAVARGWDGRFLVALGPDRHVRLAYGAKDPLGNGGGVLRLIRNIESNLELARNFTSDVPKMHLEKNAAEIAGADVHVLTISGVREQVPAQLRSLLDDKGRLRVAMSWSERAGGGMAVVGPTAPAVLEHWLGEVGESASAQATHGDLAAAVIAISPTSASSLRTANPDPQQLLRLHAEGEPYRATARRLDDARRLELHLRSPAPALPAPPRRREPPRAANE